MKRYFNNQYLRNTLLNYIYKIGGMGITYITIPLTLNYLNKERYGIWQTILTIISWAALSNFGIANGLRNKVTESITRKEYNKLKSYITNAYIYLTGISVIILIFSIIAIGNINIDIIFKNNSLQENEIYISFIIVIVSFCLNFILGISSSIAFGIQKSSLVNLFYFLTNILTLIGLFVMGKIGSGNLVNIALLYIIANTLSNIIFTIYIFADKRLRPNIKYKNKIYGREITSLGIEFFLLEVASIVLFSTDNFIISAFIGVEYITDYSVVSKLFQVISSLFSVLLVQMWASIAEYTCKGEYILIKKSMKRLIILLIPIAVILLLMSLNFNLITKIWLGYQLIVDKKLIYLASLYTWLICFNAIFVNIQNGMSKIRVQIISSIISCILNIPMAIMFIKVFELGVIGVMISNIICLSISAIICSIDVTIKINKKY